MPTEAIQKQASSRQLAYIKRLKAELGEDDQGHDNEMSSAGASRITSELLKKTQKSGISNCKPKPVRITAGYGHERMFSALFKSRKGYLGKTERSVY